MDTCSDFRKSLMYAAMTVLPLVRGIPCSNSMTIYIATSVFNEFHSCEKLSNCSCSTAKGSKIPPSYPGAYFAHCSDISTSSQNSFRDSSCISFLHEMTQVDDFIRWSSDFATGTPWRVKWRYFLIRTESSIYAFKRSGIVDIRLKHELYHLSYEMFWWHDMYTMSSHDVRRHDVKASWPKHNVGYMTFSVCRCKFTGAMILLWFRTLSRSRDKF